jgi:hypothetical protein
MFSGLAYFRSNFGHVTMNNNTLRFPSGISVKRYRQQAKDAKKAGDYPCHSHALNAIAQKELAVNWDQALKLIRNKPFAIDTRMFENELFQITETLLKVKCLQQDRLSDYQCGLIKEEGLNCIRSADDKNAAKGYGLIALSHYYRSAISADNQKRHHPLFTIYFNHWLYSNRSLFSESQGVLRFLQHLYTKPARVLMNEGKPFWLSPVPCTVMTLDEIRVVMDTFPQLNYFGLTLNYIAGESRSSRENRFVKSRASLLNAENECNRACQYLHHIKPRKTIDWVRTSYGCKHGAEKYYRALFGAEDHYISNGAFICAALHLGYRVGNHSPGSPNACFNFSRRSTMFQWRSLGGEKTLSLKEQQKFEELSKVVGFKAI